MLVWECIIYTHRARIRKTMVNPCFTVGGRINKYIFKCFGTRPFVLFCENVDKQRIYELFGRASHSRTGSVANCRDDWWNALVYQDTACALEFQTRSIDGAQKIERAFRCIMIPLINNFAIPRATPIRFIN